MPSRSDVRFPFIADVKPGERTSLPIRIAVLRDALERRYATAIFRQQIPALKGRPTFAPALRAFGRSIHCWAYLSALRVSAGRGRELALYQFAPTRSLLVHAPAQTFVR